MFSGFGACGERVIWECRWVFESDWIDDVRFGAWGAQETVGRGSETWFNVFDEINFHFFLNKCFGSLSMNGWFGVVKGTLLIKLYWAKIRMLLNMNGVCFFLYVNLFELHIPYHRSTGWVPEMGHNAIWTWIYYFWHYKKGISSRTQGLTIRHNVMMPCVWSWIHDLRLICIMSTKKMPPIL